MMIISVQGPPAVTGRKSKEGLRAGEDMCQTQTCRVEPQHFLGKSGAVIQKAKTLNPKLRISKKPGVEEKLLNWPGRNSFGGAE